MASQRPTRNQPIVDYRKLHEGRADETDSAEEPGLEIAGKGDDSTCTAKQTKYERLQTEKAALQAELASLQHEEDIRRQEQEVEDLRRLVRDKEQALKMGKFQKHHGKDKGMSSLNIETLRKVPGLTTKARKELKKLALFDNDSESSSSDDMASQKISNFPENAQKNIDLKSGIYAKSSEDVIDPQYYPHAHLRFEFVNHALTFDKLELNMFVAGELEIISKKHISSLERDGRLEFLKRLMYLNNAYEFPILKTLYVAVLREIELGYKSWGDDFTYIENTVLASSSHKFKPAADFSRGSSGSTKSDIRLWYCSKYQRNKCTFNESHMVQINGRIRLAKHVCASCWQKDKKELNHPECSSSCPHSSL